MALGFGSTEGSGSGDRVTTAFTAHATQRSYGVWIYPSDGGDSIKRVFEKRTNSGQVELVIYNTSQFRIEYERQWSGLRGRWSTPSFVADAWTHLGITYDSSNSSNDAVFYKNGTAQPVTVLNVPTGAAENNTDPYIIGNRGDGTRTFGARLAEFAIWDRILTPDEWISIGRGLSPVCYPKDLRCYVPMIRDGLDLINGVCTVTGASPRTHPPVMSRRGVWIE
jgi:hypothetical protein